MWWSCEQRLVFRWLSDFSSSRSGWSWSSRWALAKLFMIQQRRDLCSREGWLTRKKPLDSTELCYHLCLLSNWSWMQENTVIHQHQPRQNQIRKYIKKINIIKKSKGPDSKSVKPKTDTVIYYSKKKLKTPKPVANLLMYDIFYYCSQTLANHICVFQNKMNYLWLFKILQEIYRHKIYKNTTRAFWPE